MPRIVRTVTRRWLHDDVRPADYWRTQLAVDRVADLEVLRGRGLRVGGPA